MNILDDAVAIVIAVLRTSLIVKEEGKKSAALLVFSTIAKRPTDNETASRRSDLDLDLRLISRKEKTLAASLSDLTLAASNP